MTKHLLVDLDGTLLGSNGKRLKLAFIYHSLKYFGRRGIRPTRAFRGLHAMRIALETPGVRVLNQERAAAAFAAVIDCTMDQAHELLTGMLKEAFPKLQRHFHPIEGAEEFLRWARSKYRLTLATNPVWPLEVVLLRLKWAGIDPSIFDLITHAGIMHACKPSLEYYRELLEKLELKPEDSLLIGDSIRKDLPASAEGISVFLLGPANPATVMSERAWTGNFASLKKFLEGAVCER